MFREHITIPMEAVTQLCQRYHIRKLALFGSVLDERFEPDSDSDVLVEFEPDAGIGLEFVDIQDELSALFGRTVDLNTPNMLSRHFRAEVLASARVLYERTR